MRSSAAAARNAASASASVQPSLVHEPDAAPAARAERERLGTAGVLQHGERLAPKDVRMARELEEGYGGVEVVGASVRHFP